MPDDAAGWREAVSELASRPEWLWSPHGDAAPTGQEPVIVSEFGTWGLPDIAQHDSLDGPTGRWWYGTGSTITRPAGFQDRFADQGLGRVWSSPSALAAATQSLQFEALQLQIGEIKRHDRIAGYVVTELTDAYWEANGLLDLDRGRRGRHERIAELNGPVTIHADLQRRDLLTGSRLRGSAILAVR